MFEKFFNFQKKSNEKKPSSTASPYQWKKLISFNFKSIEESFWEELEEQLILSDLGGKLVVRLITELQEEVKNRKIKDVAEIRKWLKEILKKKIPSSHLTFPSDKLPVFCFIGVNGVGKTTTLAKLGHYFKKDYDLVWGAADTFRAAATHQLSEWAERLGAHLVNKGEGADSAAVVYDTVHSALARNKKIKTMAFIDTAGRLHNKENLMQELAKLIRTVGKFSEEIERKNILLLDATLGQNGLEQARIFHSEIGLDGIILTKTDTLAKGGVLLSIVEEFNLPIFFTTFGEQLDNIKPFNKEEYLNSIF